MGWPQSIVAKIEKQERRIDIIELIRLAEAIGFDASKVLRDVRAKMIESGDFEPK